jgi:hypothetical protein
MYTVRQNKSNERKDSYKKGLPIWKGILNYLMFSWNALCATNISKKKLSCSIKDNLFKAYVYIIMVTYMRCIQTH